MTVKQGRCRRFGAQQVRWLIYLFILAGIAAWKYLPRPWSPTFTLETPHYIIASTATRAQTEEVGRVVEALYMAYSNSFGDAPTFRRDGPRLKLLLYKDRAQFRWVNPNLGWAEAFYRRPYCRAYYSAREANSYHWMLHEAVHQLNAEVGGFHLDKWLEEGLACYFSTSRMKDGQLAVGTIDPNTYPVWWIDDMATAPNLNLCLTNGSVIPLLAIISNRGGPDINKEFNLYYLHWWTLTHFIFQNEKYRHLARPLVQQGGGLDAFEKLIGPIETVKQEWFQHVRRIKAALNGHDMQFRRTGKLEP